jgi:glutaminase
MKQRQRSGLVGAILVGFCACSSGVPSVDAQAPAGVQKAVDDAYAKFRTLKEGKNADYIPALAKVDPNLFGIAIVTADGKVYTAGDVKTEVRTVVGTGAPEMNPLVNPGAISATSMVRGGYLRRGLEEDYRLPQRRGRTSVDRAAGRLQVRVGH